MVPLRNLGSGGRGENDCHWGSPTCNWSIRGLAKPHRTAGVGRSQGSRTAGPDTRKRADRVVSGTANGVRRGKAALSQWVKVPPG